MPVLTCKRLVACWNEKGTNGGGRVGREGVERKEEKEENGGIGKKRKGAENPKPYSSQLT